MTRMMTLFDALSDLIARADPEVVRAELPGLFTPANLGREPMARRIGAFMDWRKRGGFELVNRLSEEAGQLDLEIRYPVNGDHWRLRLIADPHDPDRIDEMLMGRAPMPVMTPMKTGIDDRLIAGEFLEYVEHLGQHDLFSGAVLIARHGQVLGTTATGLASREYNVRNTTDTLFNVASLTKSWTATAAAILIEQDKMALTTPIAELVTLDGVTLDPKIQIRHLMSHTSGLGDYFGPGFDAKPKDQIREIEDFLALASSFDPKFDPGTRWSYSNIGMMLLGKAVARVSGLPYHDAIAALVLEPAEMNTAFFPHLDEVNRGCASGYGQRWTDEGPVAINALHSWAVRGAPDGCAFASLDDIWRFAESFRSGRLVSSDMAALMMSAKSELGARDYGYGFAVMPEGAIVGHSGGLIGASANLDMVNDPDGWTVIVLANDLSMRTPVIKARQLIGVTVQERDDAQTNMPRAGLTAR